MSAEQTQAQVQVNRPRCGYCHGDVGADDEKQGCPTCMAWSHADCWQEHGGCPACGEGAPAPRAVQRQQARAAGAWPPPGPAPAGELARFSGQRRLNSLDPQRTLGFLRGVFAGETTASTDWGFSFRSGKPARLIGRVWLEEQEHGPVVRWEVRATLFEQVLALIMGIATVWTVIAPIFFAWVLVSYPKVFMERRISQAIEAAWRNQSGQGQRTG